MKPVSICAAALLPNLHKEAYKLFCTHRFEPWLFTTFEKALLKPTSIFAVSNNQLVAYVLVSEVVGEVEIEDICVKPSFQNGGVGAKMLRHIIQQSIKTRADYVFLEVASRNSKARALYEKMGFDILSIRKNYYSLANNQFDDAVLMRRIINTSID